MAGSYSSQSNLGLFVPTTNVWDTTQIYQIENLTPELKELFVRLYQNLNTMSLALNLKDSGYYVQEEFLNSQQFFPNTALSSSSSQAPTYRQVFRKVINFGALPNATTKSVAHGLEINGATQYSMTRIYGAASKTDQSAFIPLPYASTTLNQNISLNVSITDVTITTAIDYSSYATTYIILEYLKQ